MKNRLYINLRRKIILITLLVSVTPLIVLGEAIYRQFTRVYEAKIEDQIKHLAMSQAGSVEMFLRERTSILSTIVATHTRAELTMPGTLAQILAAVSRRTEGLVDLGVIDADGFQAAYAGPYRLVGLNYDRQPWFGAVMTKGHYISDVFMGYRQAPHFIIAVRATDAQGTWILRATIDSDVFNRLVRPAQAGRSGDAYIINKTSIFQTTPRFGGPILSTAPLDTGRFGQGATVTEKIPVNGHSRYTAGAWLRDNQWLLVISQEVNYEMTALLQARSSEWIILALGCAAILVTTVLTTRIIVNRLRAADEKAQALNTQLIQSDKMAALGKMAAGIAHEINNPLAVIGEKAGWMRDLLADEDFQESENFQEYVQSIDKIEDHVERARKITHNMLGFARRMEPHLDDVEINQVLDQTLELLANHARIHNIDIQRDLARELPVIASDQSQLQQVFLNLINNAIDAIGKDGRVLISSRKEGGHIVVAIADNGPGISPEHRRRVFDPFFTTKAPGQGTGLGLSISFGIVEKMGGMITLDDNPPRGTVVTVRLPIVLPEKK